MAGINYFRHSALDGDQRGHRIVNQIICFTIIEIPPASSAVIEYLMCYPEYQR
jgi:hypothetical protein